MNPEPSRATSAPTHAATSLRRRATMVAALLSLLALALAGPAAAQSDVTCTATIGAQTVGNVIVPDGASCTLEGTTVEGNVIVGTGSTLVATGAAVDGNIQAEGARDVAVDDGRVGGSVQLFQGQAAQVDGVAVTGDVQMESNSGALRADGNTIGGNLQANANNGGLSITGNTIDGNLQCQSNDPAPTGGDNVVRGSAEDQCASLTGTAPTQPAPTEPAPTTPGTTRAIDRIFGADRFETAVAISNRAFPTGAAVVYLARADQPADALAAKSLTDGPILLVPACGDVPASVIAEIQRLDPVTVTALGGEGAVCQATLEQAAAA